MENETNNTDYLEGNLKICVFMGYEKGSTGFLIPNAPHILASIFCPEQFLNFHSSFDWLMPVIEKIEAIDEGEIGDDKLNIHFFIGKRNTRVVWDWPTYSMMGEKEFVDKMNEPELKEWFEKVKNCFHSYSHSLFDHDKKLSTWQAVVDTIDFINSKKNLK